VSPLMDAPQPADAEAEAKATWVKTRPFYWSVRRELWENRSLTLAPLAIAALVLFANLIVSLFKLPHQIEILPTLSPAEQHLSVVRHFSMAPAPIMLTAFLVGFFYSLDALYGERRDRSLLFWKSLPVAERTAVLAKASVPIVLLPAYAFLLSLATLALMLIAQCVILIGHGISPAPLFTELPFLQQPLIMIYGLTVHSLWFAPLYCFLLLVSAWAKRLPLLWVILPPVALAVVERITLDTSSFASLIGYRITGAMKEGFSGFGQGQGGDINRLSQLTPLHFLASPGLWSGLVFAVICLFLAVRLRRRQQST